MLNFVSQFIKNMKWHNGYTDLRGHFDDNNENQQAEKILNAS